ncbi:MAG TPA: hypothetical protein VGJ70_21975 [Solirubrobacteraceae bacterium]
MTRALLLATVAFVAALPAPVHAQGPPVRIGIGDQKTEMFTDPRFEELGIRLARITVPWDALETDWQRQELDDWMNAARAAHVAPLITFSHSRLLGQRRVLPTPGRFAYEFSLFRRRYPWVKSFAVWNEANHCGEPTCHRVALLVRYYKGIRRLCPGCKVLAAELLDFPNMTSWVREFRRRLGWDPGYWGLHNYRDANRLQTTNTSKLLNATHGRIWLTETGGIVNRRNKSAVGFEESPVHAAAATRWVFDRIVPLSGRIERVYLYHWNATSPYDTWDSALIGPDGKSRPAFRVLERVLDVGLRPPPGLARQAAR